MEMDRYVAGERCVALELSWEPSASQAEDLVRTALLRQGEAPWSGMTIELLPGTKGSLLIARPAAETHVYIEKWLWELLNG